jgi:uncharacterized GH25 family protein
MKHIITIFLIFLLLGAASAHEFWLLPRKFKYNVGEKMVIDFMVGEGFEGEYWDLSKHQVEKLTLFNRLGETNQLPYINRTAGSNMEYAFNNVGTYLITLESNQAFIELEPSEFEAYLKEDGLDYIIEDRQARGERNMKSRELYSRFAKLLVQVGDKTDDTYKKKTGLKFEIVPSQNPYDLKSGDYMDCKVYYRGNPEPHTLVKVWSHAGNRIFLQNIYTESDGSIRFPISSTGPWMVSTVKMIRSSSPKAEWESMWASLVFEIE